MHASGCYGLDWLPPHLTLACTGRYYSLIRRQTLESISMPATRNSSQVCWQVLQPSLDWPSLKTWFPFDLAGAVAWPNLPPDLILMCISRCYVLAQPALRPGTYLYWQVL